MSRSAIGSPIRPIPMNPTCLAMTPPLRLCLLAVDLGEHLARAAERLDRRGHAAVDRDLHEHLADLLAREAVVERAADVQLQLVAAAERGQHAEVEDAA